MMTEIRGSSNPTFELNEVDLSDTAEPYQFPTTQTNNPQEQFQKSNCDVEQSRVEEENAPQITTEKELCFQVRSSSPSKTKYNVTSNSETEEDYSILSFFSENGTIGRSIKLFKNNKLKLKNILKVISSVIAFIAYIAYMIAVLLIKTDSENTNYWCDSDGLLIAISGIAFVMIFYFKILKPFMKHRSAKTFLGKATTKKMETISKFFNYRYTVPCMYAAFISGIVIFLLIDTIGERDRLISAAGIIFFLLVGFLFSAAPRKIVWRHVIWGVGLQFMLGFFILRWPFGRHLFKCLGDKVHTFLLFTDKGSSFIFGSLVTEMAIIAFKVLSVIFFISLIIQVLYYYGIMQWIVLKCGWLLQITVGTTACESVNAAANIFLGMSEAPLMIKPYLPVMTNSELHAVMTGGFATIAGSVLAIYISFGVNPAHLLSASVMSAPAALAYAKLFYPEVEISRTKAKDLKFVESSHSNVLHAALEGVTEAIPLVTNIAASLIAFIAFIAFIDAVLSWPCDLIGLSEGTCSLSNIFGYLFTPLAFIMGVPWVDCFNVGQLIGIKTIVNEAVAYVKLGEFEKQDVLTPRSIIIATYALCGFSNLTSIGIQLGSLGAMVPERKSDLSKIAVRAMVAGSMACFLTACVAGSLISSDTELIQH